MVLKRSGLCAVVLLLGAPAVGFGEPVPVHGAVKVSVPRQLSRPRRQVAREIMGRFQQPLSGRVHYKKVQRGGLVKEVWTDKAGNRRILHRRADGSKLVFVSQDGYRGWYGTNGVMGERSAEHRWSVRGTTGKSSVTGKTPEQVVVGIVGPGEVGTSSAFQVASQLKQTGVKDVKVVLVGRDRASALGRALDVSQAITAAGLEGVTVTGTAQYRSLRKADVVVVTAGSPRKPGMSRSDLTGVNAAVMRSIATKLKGTIRPTAPVLVVTNPLDAMTHLAASILDPGSGPNRRVVGMAGALDSARLRRGVADAVARKYRVPASRVGPVSGTVLGTHGDEMVPLASSLRVDGIPATRLLDSQQLAAVVDATKKMGGTITKLAGRSAAVAPGACVAQMVTSIVTDRGDVVPASVPLRGEYGLKGLSLGVPVRLGRRGAAVVQTPLTPAERAALQRSADKVRQDLTGTGSIP